MGSDMFMYAGLELVKCMDLGLLSWSFLILGRDEKQVGEGGVLRRTKTRSDEREPVSTGAGVEVAVASSILGRGVQFTAGLGSTDGRFGESVIRRNKRLCAERCVSESSSKSLVVVKRPVAAYVAVPRKPEGQRLVCG